MPWFIITFAILALAKSSGAAQIPDSEEVQKPLSVNCTEYYSGYDDTKLETEDILGVWYHVYDHPDYVFCLIIETIDEELQKTLEAELKPYTNESDFTRFSLIARSECPNDPDPVFHLLSKIDSKGIFDAYFVPRNKSRIVWTGETVFIRNFQIESKEFLGILPCSYLSKDYPPDIFERERKGPYSLQEMKDLQFIFNNNEIVN